jgi:hypothetical protein
MKPNSLDNKSSMGKKESVKSKIQPFPAKGKILEHREDR